MITDRKIVVHFVDSKTCYNTYHEHDDIYGWKGVNSEIADKWRKDNFDYRVYCIEETARFDKRRGLII
jgi:hypothetical protein